MAGKQQQFLLAVLQSLGLAVACNIAMATNAAATEAQQSSCSVKLSVAVPHGQSIVDINGHARTFGALRSAGSGCYSLGDRTPASEATAMMTTVSSRVWAHPPSGQWRSDSRNTLVGATDPTISTPTVQAQCADITTTAPKPPLATNARGDEFVGPFASWADLKRDYGAKGDGKADDTDAIQSALSALSTSAGKSPVLYIPDGIYLITKTVTVRSAKGISVIGEDPTTTTLKWGGARGDSLLHIDGVSYSRFDRINFDGSGIAGVLVDQSVTDYSQGRQFDTGNEYADDVFQNGVIGIQGGQFGLGAAESSVLRSKFLNNAWGILLKNFNALDWWIWYSYFENNGSAISNIPGAGNFHAFNNVFQGSTFADLALLNTGNFNFRDNFSIDSNKFLYEQYYYTNAAVTRLQGNTIVTLPAKDYNDCGGCSVYQGNMGPTIMTDNKFVSPPHASGAAVVIAGQDPADCISVGNTFTQERTVQCGSYTNGNGRQISLDDKVVSASTVSRTPPNLPGVLPRYDRKVFEVVPGSNSVGIQQAIQEAAAYCGQRPVVHLPYGTYQLNQTVVIPSNCDIQLVGDGEQTALNFVGDATKPALVLEGPSRAIFRDFNLNARSATGIDVHNADQPGSRIYMQQVSALRASSAAIFVDSLDYTLVELHDFQLAYTATAPASTGVGLKVVGGPLAQQGKPQYGQTNLFAGSSGANYLSYQASLGASLIVRDAWYESNTATTYAQISDNSSVTFEGSRMATSGGSGGLAIPTNLDAIQVNNLSCNATVLSSALDSDVRVSGANTGSVWVLGNNFGTASRNFVSPSDISGAAFNLNRYHVVGYGSKPVPDKTSFPDPSFIRSTLAQSRSAHPSEIKDLASGITDVRFYRITVELGRIGIHLER